MEEMLYLGAGTPSPQKKDFIERIRDFVKKQKRTKGYPLSLTVGLNNFQLPTISGTARILLGFAVVGEDIATYIPASDMRLTINNEVIVDSTNPNFFGPQFTQEGYYFFPRPLNGSDKIELQMTGIGIASTAYIIFYYI